MDIFIQAVVMGIVQGLTEFLPISSSGHLLLVPYLLGWDDPFIESLAFSVVLHAGTLAALLVYFRDDWRRLVPAGLATLRDRSFRGDPDRRLAWLIAVATIPALIAALLFNDLIEDAIRQAWLVALTLIVGGVILWLADRYGPRTHRLDGLTFRGATGIGVAQALALIPGVSRSGISMSAALFAGLDRADAARFSFLMATPITAMAVAYEGLKLVRGEVVGAEPLTLAVGIAAAFASGILAITVLLRYLQTRSFTVFVVYRFVLAAVVLSPSWSGRSRRTAMEVMKQLRQRAIRDLVEQRPIRTQQELAAALRERGFRTTQATISRDVAELGLIKAGRSGTQAYAIPPRLREADSSGEDRIRTLLRDMPVEMRDAGTMLVLRTLPGSAHPLAAALDRARWPEVVGSIAGDDTVFVAFADRGSMGRVRRRLQGLAE